MTTATVSRAVRRPISHLGDGWMLLAMALGAAALTCLMNASLIQGTWHGQLGDPDDAMRLVEARAWLAGQHWFDMTAARLDPPHGSFMHWSRLVDLPVAAMIKLFGLFSDPATAERLALLTVPTVWLVALYAGVARLSTLLLGREGSVPMLLGMILSGAALVQFAPGRIGHHAPETVALVFAVGFVLAALDGRHARQGFIAGVLVALSLAMSLETLPFHVALIGILVLLWVSEGFAIKAMLAWFATGLLTALPIFFALTVGPDRWLASVCDAYSAAHLGAGMIGAAGLLGLALMTPRLSTRTIRIAAATVPALGAGAFVATAYPACLHSPFSDVDAAVRALWLDHVTESLPLPSFLRAHPMVGTAIAAPAVLGVVGSVAAAASTRGTTRLRFIVVAALSAFGVALAFWQVRVLATTTPLALCGGVYLVVRCRAWFAFKSLAVAARLAPLAIVPFTSTAWALALPNEASRGRDLTSACLAPEALSPLASLPAGTVVAPINSGSHLLMTANLSVFAAPYHRNNDGNLYALNVFMAPPERARELLAERDVRFVITCPGMSSWDRLAARAPQGLAAQLSEGRTPTFLTERRLDGTPYRVYEVHEKGH